MSISVSRKGRARKPREMYTPSKGQQSVGVKRTTNYGLNKNKAIQKKIDSTYQDEINTEYKRGTLVITLPTAEFEAFRICVKSLDKINPNFGIKIKIDISSDKNGLIVGESISVKQQSTDKQLYRINLHLTTSVVSVNGGSLSRFTESHIDQIVAQMEKMGNFKELNKTIRSKLQAAEKTLDLKQLESKEEEKCTETQEKMNNEIKEYQQPMQTGLLAIGPPKQQQDNNETNGNDTVMGVQSHRAIKQLSSEGEDKISDKNTKKTVCSVCDQSCMERRVMCDTCGHWSHYSCENLSDVEVSEMESSESANNGYTCRGCWSLEAMLRSDVISEDNVCPNKEEENNKIHQVYSCDKAVETTRTERCSVGTNTIANQQQDNTTIQKEYAKTLKQMESEMKKKEENISDLAKQLATARAYIITLEQKINSLEKSKHIQERTTTQQEPNLSDGSFTNQRLNLLEHRLNAMEINTLKERMSALEQKVGAKREVIPTVDQEHQQQAKVANVNIPGGSNTTLTENKAEGGRLDKGPDERYTESDERQHHFLGKRHHAKEPPWEIQGGLSQKKKRRKKKKSSVGQLASGPSMQNTDHTKEIPAVQRNLHQPIQNFPVMLQRPQILQQQPLMTYVPQAAMTNRMTPLQGQTIPWVMTNSMQPQNQQRGMIQNQIMTTSYMKFQ